MIDPRHECWWSDKKLTEIRVAGSDVSGAGVPLRVLLHAFKGTEVIWYSTIYGEYDDNILLLAFDRAYVNSFERILYTSVSPIQAAWGDALAFEEYVLSDAMRSELGLSFEGNTYHCEHDNLPKYQVYIHDDCFFLIKPTDDALLERLVHCILQQHSYYLGTDVNWSGILTELTRQVRNRGRVEIRSDPRHGCLVIPQTTERKPFLQRILKPGPVGAVLIRDGKAYFREEA